MAYNEQLADKLRIELERRNIQFEEKEMMGGLCVMVDDLSLIHI